MEPDDFHIYLKGKAGAMLKSLENEVDALRKILLNLENNVKKVEECATHGFDQLINSSDIEVKFKQIYPDIAQLFEVVDEWLTVLCSTVLNSNIAVEDGHGEIWEDKPSLSGGTNYMLKKMWGKLNTIKTEGDMALRYVKEVVEKLEGLLLRARLTTSTFNATNKMVGTGLDSYKEVSKMLWETDMEITELRASLPICMPDISDIRSGSKMVRKVENQKDQILTSRPVMLTRRQHVPLSSQSTSPLMTNQASPLAALSSSFAAVNKNIKNCLSIVIKSTYKEFRIERAELLRERLKQIKDLISNFQLLFMHSTCPVGANQVVLDIGFSNSADARKFSLDLKKFPPKFLHCFLLSEAELGYQHEPVLTEGDLLFIQSPRFSRNVFRTSLNITVLQIGHMVTYQFKSVTDVNRFLFNHSNGTHKARFLGQLRKNIEPKRLIPDPVGSYRLVTTDIAGATKLEKRANFTISLVGTGGRHAPGMAFLLFLTRLDLFEFILSKGAAGLLHLQFDESRIENESLE